jgi:predicted transporter
MTEASEPSKSAPESPTSGWQSIQWWPTAIGLAFAAFVSVDLLNGSEHGTDLAAIVVASGLVYLAAAALEIRWVSWPVFLLSVVVITVARFGLIPFDATWAMLILAALFAVYGVIRALRRPNRELPLQAIAMSAFGGLAAVALFISPFVGALLVAAGLVAHAGWDVYHHVKNKVVVRSMAEFCFVLDTALAIVIVLATLRG